MLNLLTHKVFLAGIFAAFLAQLLKTFFSKKKLSAEDIWITGGMPSSHTALVTAATSSCYLTEGATAVTAITLLFSVIVIRDALGIRRCVGEISTYLTTTIDKRAILHKSLGHTPKEVLAGAIVGLVMGISIGLM